MKETEEKKEKDVLMVVESEASFLVNSIKSALEKNEMEVASLTVTMDKFTEEPIDSSLVIVQGADYGEKAYKSLVYLKDICYEQDKKVILFGNSDEISVLKRLFPSSIIEAVFVRPLDVSQVVEAVEQAQKHLSQMKELKRVLVVDDSGMMLRTIMSWLEGKYNVSLANSAASAFSSINQNCPDLILLDYEMPVCSGARFMEMLRAEPSTENIPVIFLTSKGDAETVKKVLSLKPEGYLLKTTPSDQVIETINKFFQKQREKMMYYD